jgi:uncharacterized protein (TIGR02118 family)
LLARRWKYLVRGTIPGWLRGSPGCTYHNNQNSHWERSNGKSCRPLQKSEKHRSLREHYSSVHIPLAKKIPGLKKFDISTGAVGTPAGPSGIYLVATLYFDSADALKASLASAEGQATAGDLANFADGGAELHFFDTKEV